MKKIFTKLASVALVAAGLLTSANANAQATTLYLIGQPAGGWDPAKGLPCTPVDGQAGVFTIDIKLTATQWFGFAQELNQKADWNALNAVRYGATQNNATPQTGDNGMLFPSENSWQLPAGDYTLTINTNPGSLNLKLGGEVVTKIGDLYVRGEMTDNFAALDDWKLTTVTPEEEYKIEGKSFTANQTFKIGNGDWGFQLSTNKLDMTAGDYDFVTEGTENMSFAEDMTNVSITVNIPNKKMTITGTSGVANVNIADEAPATWFNLQGQRVDNPEKGLYIRVQNGKSAKVIR